MDLYGVERIIVHFRQSLLAPGLARGLRGLFLWTLKEPFRATVRVKTEQYGQKRGKKIWLRFF